MDVKGRDFRLTDRIAGVFCYQILHNSGEIPFVVSSNTREVISILPNETGTKAHIFARRIPVTSGILRRRSCLLHITEHVLARNACCWRDAAWAALGP